MTVCESHSLERGKHFPGQHADEESRLAFSHGHGKPAGTIWKTVGILFALFSIQVCWGETIPSAINFSSRFNRSSCGDHAARHFQGSNALFIL